MIRSMLKLGLVMALYAAAACVGLAFVYEGTKERIASNERRALEAALFEIFPDSDAFEPIETLLESPDSSVRFDSAWVLFKGDSINGLAVRTLAESYGGTLTSLVGVDSSRKIRGVRVLTNADTPGLGANAASPTYYVDRATKTTFFGQFTGKSASDPFRVIEALGHE